MTATANIRIKPLADTLTATLIEEPSSPPKYWRTYCCANAPRSPAAM